MLRKLPKGIALHKPCVPNTPPMMRDLARGFFGVTWSGHDSPLQFSLFVAYRQDAHARVLIARQLHQPMLFTMCGVPAGNHLDLRLAAYSGVMRPPIPGYPPTPVTCRCEAICNRLPSAFLARRKPDEEIADAEDTRCFTAFSRRVVNAPDGGKPGDRAHHPSGLP